MLAAESQDLSNQDGDLGIDGTADAMDIWQGR
jgi:hypothetical protein